MEVDSLAREVRKGVAVQQYKPNNEIAFYNRLNKTETEKLTRIAATRCKVAFPPDGIELETKKRLR